MVLRAAVEKGDLEPSEYKRWFLVRENVEHLSGTPWKVDRITRHTVWGRLRIWEVGKSHPISFPKRKGAVLVNEAKPEVESKSHHEHQDVRQREGRGEGNSGKLVAVGVEPRWCCGGDGGASECAGGTVPGSETFTLF